MQHSYEALDRPGGLVGARLFSPLRHRDFRVLWVGMAVSLLGDGTAGLTVDGFGGIHRFGVGVNAPGPKVIGAAKWPGWNIARDVALLAS